MKDREKRKEKLRNIFQAGLTAVDPEKAVSEFLELREKNLRIGDRSIDLGAVNNIYVIGFGKASGAMAAGAESILKDWLTEGHVTVKDGYTAETSLIRIEQASHPLPDQRSLDSSKAIMHIAEKAGKDDLVICLISGGGSSLFELLPESISLQNLQKTTDLLLSSGADIQEINTVRQQLSLVKGGKLASAVYPAQLFALVLSDVPGDHLPSIASGPTSFIESDKDCAIKVLEKYSLADKVDKQVISYLSKPGTGLDHDVFNRVNNLVIGSNIQAAKKSAEFAEQMGHNTLILSSAIGGDAREVAAFISSVLREIRINSHPVKAPACIITGGETTVRVRGSGKGGRAMELAMSMINEIAGINGISLMSCATDGTDGPTDSAGAFVDCTTLDLICEKGLCLDTFVSNNDSYHLFKELGDLLITGPTRTNVNDLYIGLVE